MAMRFPYQLSSRGTTATASASEDAYIRDLMSRCCSLPGERVHRPDFGGGRTGWFCAGGDAAATALQANVRATLQRWLQTTGVVQAVSVDVVDSGGVHHDPVRGPAHPADAGGAVSTEPQQRFVFCHHVRGSASRARRRKPRHHKDEHCDDARHAGH